MSVRKRKDTGRWQARYTGLDGKPYSRDFDLKSDAQKWEREQKRLVENGSWLSPNRGYATIEDVYLAWINSRVDVKKQTLLGYEQVWKRLVAPRWSKTRLTNVTPSDVQEWIVNLKGVKGQGLGASRKRQAHQVLAMILDHALRDGRIPKNPARYDAVGRIKYLPKQRLKTEHRYLTAKRLKYVASQCGEYETLVLLMGTTGLRWGEATALTVADIDWLRRRVRVTKAHVDDNGIIRIDTPKNHQARSVPLMGWIVDRLSVHVQGREDTDLLFTASDGSPLRSSNFHNRVWKPARTAAGEPGLRVHDLRHTAASLAVASGANVKGVQQMLGHASAQMTLDRYAGLFDGHLDDVAERMEAQFHETESDSDVTEEAVVLPLSLAQ